jgi:hypothetical protein
MELHLVESPKDGKTESGLTLPSPKERVPIGFKKPSTMERVTHF